MEAEKRELKKKAELDKRFKKKETGEDGQVTEAASSSDDEDDNNEDA